MTDKERILMVIITRIISGLAYCSFSERDKYVKSTAFGADKLEHGDLVFANTSIYPNDFIVGFVNTLDSEKGCVVVREIGSERLCNYYNESFTRINKEKIGYEVLEGLQYVTYQKVLKAFSYSGYWTRFKSISFSGNMCTVQSREPFSNEVKYNVQFNYNSKTSIKSIRRVLEGKENQQSNT